MRLTEELCQRFRAMGYRVTPQRRYIFQVLEGNTDHLSAEEVYEKARAHVPDISLATVYNTLRELVSLGEIRELDWGEGKSRYDPDTSCHQHLICVRCHNVADVACGGRWLELAPEQRQGYHVLGADVTFYGLCSACQGQHQENGPGQLSRVWGVTPIA